MMGLAVILIFQRWKQIDPKSKAIFGYIASTNLGYVRQPPPPPPKKTKTVNSKNQRYQQGRQPG